MMVSILANIGIIMLNIYIIWKIAGDEYKLKKLSWKESIRYIVLETIAGMSLMFFSVTIMDVRFDLRFILISLCMRYLGEKVTLPTIFLLAIGRFLYGGLSISIINFFTAMILILTLGQVYKWSKRHFRTLGQLLTMNYYYIAMLFPGILVTLGNLTKVLEITVARLVIGTAFTIIIHAVVRDFKNLTTLTITDGLTDLYNLRKFYQDLERLDTAQSRYAMVVLDIDNFKCYNDLHGHLLGDKVLQELSRILKSFSGVDYSFYRYGGEEFVTIIKDEDGKKAYTIADIIKNEVSSIAITNDQDELINITVSIGIAYQRSGEDLLVTFDRADKALYVAKVNGKNQIVIG